MNKSESIANLAAALAKARAEFPPIGKTKEVIVTTQKGPFKFFYAPLEETLKAITPIMSKYGLFVTQGAEGLFLVTMVMHESGEWLSHSMPLPEAGTNQQYGAAMTYRRRYSLEAALNLKMDDLDDDPYAEAQKEGKKDKRQTPRAGSDEKLTMEQFEKVRRIFSSCVDAYPVGGASLVWEIIYQDNKLDADEQVCLADMMDSKMRTAIRKEAERRREAQKEAEAGGQA